MIRPHFRLISIFTLLVLAATPHIASAQSWLKSYSEALAKGKSENKLAMIFFHADWCTYCQRMKATTFKSPDVWQSMKYVAPVMLNIDKEGAKIKETLGVRMFPAFVFLAPDGTKFAEMNGYIGPTMFADEVEKYATAFRSQGSLLAAYRKNPASGEANARLAWLYAIRRDEAAALKHLDVARKAKYSGAYIAGAYNMVGDVFQISERLGTAVKYFRLGLETSKSKEDTAYALVSLFSCYSIMGDKKNAKTFGEKLLAMPGAPKEYVEFVKEQMVKRGIKE